jgi:hypothetical protein
VGETLVVALVQPIILGLLDALVDDGLGSGTQ